MKNSEYPSSIEIPQPINMKSRRAHRRESFWQILLPLILGIALIFGVPYLVISGGVGSLEAMSQIASMMLALPMLIIGILLFIVIVVLTYLVSRIMGLLPPQSFRVQRLIQNLNLRIRRFSDLATSPLIRLESWSEAARSIVDRRR